MNNQEFYKEIDRLVENGETTFPEYDIDIEAFHHLKAIKVKNRINKGMNILFATILFFFAAALTVYVIAPGRLNLKEAAFLNPEKREIVEREVLFDSILSENVKLKGIIAKMESSSQKTNVAKQAQGYLKKSPPEISDEDKVSKEDLIYHVVKSGETLFSLAKQYYGSGSMAVALMEDNGISNPSELAIGMTLVIHKK